MSSKKKGVAPNAAIENKGSEYIIKLPYSSIRAVYSSNDFTRIGATSGGFVSELIKYLFRAGMANTMVGYGFTGKDLFRPELLYRVEDYRQCGSIYHDVGLLAFLKENYINIKGAIVIVCLPCECGPIGRFLDSIGCEHYIIALTCSNQLNKEATFDFLTYNKIDRYSIAEFKYRGNGWPSGISIQMNDDEKIFFHNNKSTWPMVFHSGIYTLKKCFKCPAIIPDGCDFVVADPWLRRFMDHDALGHSMVCINTARGEVIFQKMVDAQVIVESERISENDFLLSQIGTLKKKILFKKSKTMNTILGMIRSKIWKKLFWICPRAHDFVLRQILKILTKKLKIRTEKE